MTISSPVSDLPGIGPVMAKKLEKLDIFTIFDLLYHLPFRYEDRSRIDHPGAVQSGETVTIIGTIDKITNTYTKSGKFIQVAKISDHTGSLPVMWFNQMFLSRTIPKNSPIALYGKVEFYNSHPTLFAPEYELMDNLIDNSPSTDVRRGGEGVRLLHMGRIIPVYPETAGVSSKWLRTKIHALLNTLDLSDFYPTPPEFPHLIDSLRHIHFPDSLDQTEAARRRLAFDELLMLQITALLRKDSWRKTKHSTPFKILPDAIANFQNSLPFSLTADQKTAIAEILHDLSQPHPANRLLEGDVGSGKTAVAAAAAYCAHLNNFQTLIMAPTQILAQQHHKTLTTMFQTFNIDIGLITSTTKTALATKQPIVVGTHSLLSPDHDFTNVGLVIIDEQHRFGVAQRALATQTGQFPHVVTMTATPIPRTIVLSLYGDLDLSVLKSSPPGRLPVKTWVVPEQKREGAYTWIQKHLEDTHHQAFIVCPFIDDSETLSSVKSATSEFAKLQKIFTHHRLGLLHGKLKTADKDAVINSFRAGEIDILVSTPVVEVGIDIPNASIMLIEGANHFGLAQLHQLRGRVGRNGDQAYCLLFSDEKDTTRLDAMHNHHSGMELAEIDLRIRGPGQMYGTAQHGSSQFKIANYSDLTLLEEAKVHAQRLFSTLYQYPVLRRLIKDDKIAIVQPN